jgi:hypothetical protein
MFAVLIPVGPDARDVSRLAALVDELRRHEDPPSIRLLLVDDAPETRDLAVDWPDYHVLRTPLWSGRRPDLMSAHVAGALEGLRAARGLDFAVKLDTDAAVIRPFSAAIARVFEDRRLGVVGSYDVKSDGSVRDWSGWKRLVERADRPVTLARVGRSIQIWRHTRSDREAVRRVRAAAFRFAPPGAHCLGGAYAVSAALIEAVSTDWHPWVRTRLGEDVVVGLLCSAAGLNMKSLTGFGEPFALSWRGLPAPPSAIAWRGHSIVHSVKCDDEQAEEELRALLQELTA